MPEERALTVLEAVSQAKYALERVAVRVIGEVSELSDKPGYKAAYFTVADERACMPCLMWRDDYADSGVELACGMLVEIWGAFSVYPAKGRMQFVVRRLQPAGEGALRMQVAAIARRLESEGLMRVERKRPLPQFPVRIAVVTSPRGKAVHDVLRTLARRYPLAEVIIAGVPVEGASAAQEIARGLSVAAKAAPDLILLVRGGGSYEDLMPFNDETLAREIAACTVPVVTGIGHEPDMSIADMVADVSASTPTAAAETATPAADELAQRVDKMRRLLASALRHRVRDDSHRVALLARRPVLCDTRALLGPAAQAIDLAAMSLQRALPLRLQRDGERVGYLTERLVSAGPRIHERAAERVRLEAARLGDLSPLAILGRGYAVCFARDGRTVVKSVTDVSPGDRVRVRVAQGHLGCVVENTEEGT